MRRSLALPASALEWRWSYQGEGVTAAGAFTTTDTPNADGFYAITAIKGEANGVAITGLQPAGTSIPGNDGYPVDGLVGAKAPQLSLHGFGYALADGTYANPFTATISSRRAFTRFSPIHRTARRASRW